MGNSRKQKEMKNKKAIDELKKELKQSDEVYDNIAKNPARSISIGMQREGFQPHVDFDLLLEQFKLEVSEFNLKLKSGFKIIDPEYEYQNTKEWEQHLEKATKLMKKEKEIMLKELEEKLSEVKAKIDDQRLRS